MLATSEVADSGCQNSHRFCRMEKRALADLDAKIDIARSILKTLVDSGEDSKLAGFLMADILAMQEESILICRVLGARVTAFFKLLAEALCS